MTRQEMIVCIQQYAAKLGRSPSLVQVLEHTKATPYEIKKYFLTYTRALKACGLEPHTANKGLDVDLLLRDWARVSRKLKKLPTSLEYNRYGNYSGEPFRRRFGLWTAVPRAMADIVQKQNNPEKWADIVQMIRAHEENKKREIILSNSTEGKDATIMFPGRRVYGGAVRAAAMSHGPVNELGVIFAFGTVAERLGYIVNHIQAQFPDCQAMRRIGKDRYQPVHIEFEYESRNFLAHGHSLDGCDLIVCWIHNWPECPLEVIELRKLFMADAAAEDKQ